ncbi:MAG: AMP-forming long-chain acyl-CoA [Desulfobulbaceae bacterium]|nr:MAG: AMP-forming long-chain acyl-CoA [Desulfobulbaceae bacterium]
MEKQIGVNSSLNDILDVSQEKFSALPAVGMALDIPLTYQEFYQRIIALALRLSREGVKKGDHVAILAENSPNWGAAYFAIVRLGAVAVPILPDLPEADVHHILAEMRVPVLFTTERQIEKIYELKQKKLRRIITLDDSVASFNALAVEPFTDYLAEAMEMRDEAERKGPIVFDTVTADDLASILYTSGTSGYSKAVMLSHRNLAANAQSASSMIDVEPGAVFLSILPMSHTYEFTVGFILPLLRGARIAYAGKTPTPAILQKLCRHEKPYAIFVVPLVMEKIYKKRVLPKITESFALSLLCKVELGRRFIHKRIGAKLLEFFGGNLKVMGIGGAALNPEVEQFLYNADFPYLIGYGLTECAPLLAGGPPGDKSIVVGSTGKPVPGVRIKIVHPDPVTGIGEIYGQGPNVMQGYFNDPDATAETLTADGWIATGDLGFIDDFGNLHIRGRSKNVIVMSNGENVYPEAIEHKINVTPWVVESLVVENNGRLEAWVYPDYEYIDAATVGQGRSQRHQYIEALLAEMRTKINEQVSPAARLARILERQEPFIKTATHKIKRYLYSGGNMKL